jgi:hypothetical protein
MTGIEMLVRKAHSSCIEREGEEEEERILTHSVGSVREILASAERQTLVV